MCARALLRNETSKLRTNSMRSDIVVMPKDAHTNRWKCNTTTK